MRLRLSLAIIGLVVPASVFAATSPFGDVDPADTFFGNIVNMANSGITSGCGGGNYCPDDPVTRGQMAAFLNRAAPRESVAYINWTTAAPADGATIASVSVKSLNNEYLSISGSLTTYSSGSGVYPCENHYVFSIDGVAESTPQMISLASSQPANMERQQLVGHLLVPVGPGTHTVALKFDDDVGSCSHVPGRGAVWVQVVPFDGSMNSITSP